MMKSWFEMQDLKQRRFDNAVWIPLYACQQLEQSGKYGYDGYKEEFFGCGTLAVPIEKRAIAYKLGWMEIGIGHDHSPWINEEGMSLMISKNDFAGRIIIYSAIYNNNFCKIRIKKHLGKGDKDGEIIINVS